MCVGCVFFLHRWTFHLNHIPTIYGYIPTNMNFELFSPFFYRSHFDFWECELLLMADLFFLYIFVSKIDENIFIVLANIHKEKEEEKKIWIENTENKVRGLMIFIYYFYGYCCCCCC